MSENANTTKLRAAAERLRGHKQAMAKRDPEASPYCCDEGYDVSAIENDLDILADAFCAENPADDDEPITEEFCETLNLECVERHELYTDFRLTSKGTSFVRFVPASGTVPASVYVFNGGYMLVKTPTRRQVRQLLEVLGVNTK